MSRIVPELSAEENIAIIREGLEAAYRLEGGYCVASQDFTAEAADIYWRRVQADAEDADNDAAREEYLCTFE